MHTQIKIVPLREPIVKSVIVYNYVCKIGLVGFIWLYSLCQLSSTYVNN